MGLITLVTLGAGTVTLAEALSGPLLPEIVERAQPGCGVPTGARAGGGFIANNKEAQRNSYFLQEPER